MWNFACLVNHRVRMLFFFLFFFNFFFLFLNIFFSFFLFIFEPEMSLLLSAEKHTIEVQYSDERKGNLSFLLPSLFFL